MCFDLHHSVFQHTHTPQKSWKIPLVSFLLTFTSFFLDWNEARCGQPPPPFLRCHSRLSSSCPVSRCWAMEWTGEPLCLPRGASVPRSPSFWACIWPSAFVRRLTAPGLCLSATPQLLPSPPHDCHRCWGRQLTLECGFHGKAILSVRRNYHGMPQWFKKP